MQDSHRTSINSAALTADEVARRNFPIVRKGFDPTDVRMFLDSLAEQLQVLHDREDDLRRRLAKAEQQVSHPEMDEAVLTAALGEETTRVLRSAHDAAGDMKARAEEGAAQVMHLAHEEAARIRAEGERAAADRSSEADVTAAGVRAAAGAEADSVIEAARQEAQAMIASVQEECRGMVREAQEVRARVLGDLVRRRRALYGQVEQLRGGRQSLVEALRDARTSFDHILETLQRDFDTGGVVQRPADDPLTESRAAPTDTNGPESQPDDTAGRAARSGNSAAPRERRDETAAPKAAPASGDSAPPGSPAEATDATATSPGDRPDDTAGPTDQPEQGEAAKVEKPPNGRRPGLRVIRRSRSVPIDEVPQRSATDEASVTPESPADEGVRIIASSTATVDTADEKPGGEGETKEQPSPAPRARSRGRTRGRHRAPGSSAVDELFAKIRAGRTSPAGRDGQRRKSSDEKSESTAGPVGRPESTAGPVSRPESTAAVRDHPDDVAATGALSDQEDTTGQEGRSVEGSEKRPEGSILRRRDDAIGPITVALSRRLKRALQDDQNELLDRLRSRREGPLVEILPPAAKHREHFRRAGLELLDRAEQAGSSFLRSPARGGKAAGDVAKGGGNGNEDGGSIVLADELATAIIDPLRRRLERSLGDAADPEEANLVESVGGAYREWKGSRIERVAGDHVVAAFSRGELGVARAGTVLRWIVDDGDERCPDCDDNALAGPLPLGERYPTGQAHPPAHSGCRCLLAPPPA